MTEPANARRVEQPDPARRMATARKIYPCVVCEELILQGDSIASVEIWVPSPYGGTAPRWRWVHLICALDVT